MDIQIIAENNGTNFKHAPAGNHIARCFSMIHIGTIEETFNGETKKLNKVRISWELPTELDNFGKDKDEPYVISKDFTLSMNEKATLRKFLESWRGKAFSEEEAKKFNIAKLVGAPCQLQIIKKTSKSGKEYSDISSIATLLKGVQCPEQINKSVIFSILAQPFQKDLFDSFPEFLQNKIKSSEEFKKIQMPNETEIHSETQNDDLPF